MSIDMYLGDSDRQNQSVSSIIKSRSNHYNNLQGTLVQFSNASPFLSGVTYDSAKNYSQKILIPLIKAGMLLDEAVKESCEAFTKKYREEVDTVDLRESELLDKINRVEIFANQARNLMSLEFRNEHPNATYLRNLQRIEDNHLETKRLLEEKLAKLRAFNSNSRAVFAKVDELYQLVQKGINEATHSWSEVGRSYLLNEKAIETWMESINQHWINSSYYIMAQMAEIVKKGLKMSEDEFERLKRYLEGHPKVAFYNEGINLIKLYPIVKWGNDKGINLALNTTEEVIKNLLNQLHITIPRGLKYFNFSMNSQTFKNIGFSFDASKYISDVEKYMLKNLGKGFVREVEISLADVAKGLGYYVGDNVGRAFTFSISGLKSVFLGIDMYLNSLEEKIGTAIVHTLTTAKLTNIGVNLIKGGLSTLFSNPLIMQVLSPLQSVISSHPIGWAILSSFAVTYLIEEGYKNNFVYMRDIIDYVGQSITNSIEYLQYSFGW
ncbi:hypothetical protein O3796_08060 [Granulicatella adiacens]|uniref:hypothetical protein n=1 Tax=Granulicatella adiacens TaxID=46124 RepID=UPI00352F2942